jgi:hypothetical protein
MLRGRGEKERRRKCFFTVAPQLLSPSASMPFCTVAPLIKRKGI